MNIEYVIMTNGVGSAETAQLNSVSSRENIEGGRQLVLADFGIADADVLLASLSPDTDVWRVDADTDFASMLRAALLRGYERLHFLAHGQPGAVMFGGKLRDVDDFIANSVGDKAPSLHFWSCRTGAGAAGNAFVQRVSAAFGSVVTAFSGLVGAADKGGCWLPDVLSSNFGRDVSAPFMNRLAYAHTLAVADASALKLTSIRTETGVEVQIWLTAGTVIDSADLVLSYDTTKGTYVGAVGNSSLDWTWFDNEVAADQVSFGGYSGTAFPFSSSSDVWLGRVSFALPAEVTSFMVSLHSDTGLSLSGEEPGSSTPVELGTLPVLDALPLSHALPLWDELAPPPGIMEYAQGATISLDIPFHATDADSATLTYSAVPGTMIDGVFVPISGELPIELVLGANGHLTGSITVPEQADPGSYVLRLLADDDTTDNYLGTAYDMGVTITPNNCITINTTGTVNGTPQPWESYYKFTGETGGVAAIGDAGFSLTLVRCSESDGLTFIADWTWYDEEGNWKSMDTGNLTFIDTNSSTAGPEMWSAVSDNIETGSLIADSDDVDSLPDGFVFYDDMDNVVNVTLNWQTRDEVTDAIATFSTTVKNEDNEDITFSGSLIDSDENDEPDRIAGNWGDEQFNDSFLFADTNGDSQPDTWTVTGTETRSGRVQVDANGNPAGLYMTWNDNPNPTPTEETLTYNALTFNLGITAPQLASTGYITVKAANPFGGMSVANISVSALTINGSYIIASLTGTDALSGDSYYLNYNVATGSSFFVQVPAGVVVGQTEDFFKAWQVGDEQESSYALSPMTVVHNDAGTNDGDWVLGTSGNDTIAAGDGNDVLDWPVGNDVVDAGDGYDHQYLPVPGMYPHLMPQLDESGVLHLVKYNYDDPVNSGSTTDVYRISRLAPSEYRIDSMDSTGLNVVQTLYLSNAEALSAGYHPTYLAVQYNTESGYVSGTAWDDTITFDTASVISYDYVWGDTGYDELVMTLAPLYSGLEIVNNGVDYVLQGTLAGSSGTVVELGQLTMSSYSGLVYGGSITFGTGEDARLFSFSGIEAFRFVSGSLVYDFTLHSPIGFVGIDGDPLQGETLTAWYYLSDYDFEDGIIPPEAIHYQWQADGVNIDEATSDELVLGEALVDKSISLIVSYTDPYSIDESILSYNSVVVVNVNDLPTGAVTIEGVASKGEVLTAISTLADADGLGDISYQWYRGTEEIQDATENTYTPTVFDVGNAISVTASYWDGHDTWESVQSAATDPVIDNTNNPATGTVTISGTATQNKTLIANFTILDFDGVGESVYTYQWKADDIAITGATNRNYLLKEAEVGKKITVTVSFKDDADHDESLTSSATRAVVNVNDRLAGTVTIDGTAEEDQILTAVSALTDADGLGAIRYQWQADGGSIAGATESTYTLTQAEVGAAITVVASYTDGHGTHESKSSEATATVANVNDAPALFEGETLIVGSAVVGEELFVNSGVLSDEDGPDVLSITRYQWQADSADIAGATHSFYEIQEADKGKSIRVIVTYTDDYGEEESFTSAATAAVVENAVDPNGSVAISGTLTQGETLTATVTDGDGFGPVTYQWQVNTGTAAAELWTNITGATGATLLLKEAQVGKAIKVSASYTDNDGTIESHDSSATAAVVNVNDTPTGNVTLTGTAKQGETLTASNTLADLDGIAAGAISYLWKANGFDIAGAAGDHYTLTQAEVGKTVTVIAHYIDGHGHEENVPSVATDPVTNFNDAPTGIVKISGGGQQGEILTASNTLADADGMGTVSYQWQANGVNIIGAENDWYQLTQAEVGATITVIASYTDGGGTDESVRSAATSAILNVNDRPTGGVIIDGTVQQGQRLTVNTSALDDADGIPAQSLVQYQWQAGGLNIHGATSSNYLLTQAEVGKAITVKVSYIDRQNTSESVLSTATVNVANVNDLPTGTVTISMIDSVTGNDVALSGAPAQGKTLSATNTLVDSDGPPTLAISYQWQADGADIYGAVGRYYALTQADVGTRIAVVASYTDAFTKVENMSSTATEVVENVNDVPTGTVTISGDAKEGATLTAMTSTLADADGLGTLSYQWYAVNALNAVDAIIGATTSSYILTSSEIGDAIKVVVSYTDGGSNPESVTSALTRPVVNTNNFPTGDVTITGTPVQGATLTASNTLADADGIPAGAITYQWYVNGASLADGASYVLTEDEVGQHITVVASYTDNDGTHESKESSATDVVANRDDDPVGSVTITGTAKQGATLTANTSGLTDPDGMGQISYQWRMNTGTDAAPVWTNIAGATANIFAVTEAQVGKRISYIASFTDGHGASESVPSGNTAKVQNLNDLPTGSVTISGIVKVGKTLTADNTINDADGLGAISYQWQANGSDIYGATDREYTLTRSEKGKVITVVASYIDGHGTLEQVPSAATAPVKAVIRGSAHDGYLVNALVWVDDYNDAVRDWTDNNHNNIWDEGEGESWTVTDSTGQFTGLEGTGVLRITANPNGATIDISTGNDFTGSFAAPSDATVISALTTLVAAAIDGTTDAAAAAEKVKTALALDASVTVTSYDPIAEASKTTTSDAARLVAIKAQSATIQVNNIMDVAVSVAQAAGAPVNTTSQIVEKVADSLLAQAGSGTVDLTSATVIATALKAGIPSGAPIPSDAVINAIATALALANSDIAHTAGAATGTTTTAVADITAIVEAQIVAQNTIVPDAYAAVAANDAGLVTTNTTNFDALLTEAAGQVETIFVNHLPTGSVTISGEVMPGETLTAANSLVDVEGVGTISYQWLSNGLAITDATHETYALTAADIGKAITVKASYTDGAEHIESVNSDPTALLPDAPTSLSDVVVAAASLTNDTTPTVAVDLSDKVFEVGDIIQIIDSNHNNAVVGSYTVSAEDVSAGITIKDIELLVGLMDDAHALKVQLVDGAGNSGLSSNAVTTVTIDTTLPVISHPWFESGVVTAALDAVLETGDELYGSVDDGQTWADITGKVTGTAVNWDGLSGADPTKLQLKIQDAAGNQHIDDVLSGTGDGYDLTGTITFWKGGAAIAGVTTGISDTLDFTSGTDGAYSFAEQAQDDYTVTATKAATGLKSYVNLADAITTLKIAYLPSSALNTVNFDGSAVSPYQYLAADVNKNGKVNLADAIMVLKFAFLPTPPQPYEWVFVPDSVGNSTTMNKDHVVWPSAPSVTLDHDTEVDLIGIVLGDVNGSWHA